MALLAMPLTFQRLICPSKNYPGTLLFSFFTMQPVFGHFTFQTFLLEVGGTRKSKGDPCFLGFLRNKASISFEFVVLV